MKTEARKGRREGKKTEKREEQNSRKIKTRGVKQEEKRGEDKR